LRGLSSDELECIAEFQGAYVLESSSGRKANPYHLIHDFFNTIDSERWNGEDDRACKTLLMLAWVGGRIRKSPFDFITAEKFAQLTALRWSGPSCV
jgi:hypothetical protein